MVGADRLLDRVQDIHRQAGVVVGDALPHAGDQRMFGPEALLEESDQLAGRVSLGLGLGEGPCRVPGERTCGDDHQQAAGVQEQPRQRPRRSCS